MNKESSISGDEAVELTRAEYSKPVAIAQPVIGRNTIAKAITLAALTNNKLELEEMLRHGVEGLRFAKN